MKTKRRNIKKPKRVAKVPPRTTVEPAYTTLIIRPVDGRASLRTDNGGLTWYQTEFPDNRTIGATVPGIVSSNGGGGGGGIGRTVEIGKWRGES